MSVTLLSKKRSSFQIYDVVALPCLAAWKMMPDKQGRFIELQADMTRLCQGYFKKFCLPTSLLKGLNFTFHQTLALLAPWNS